MTGQTYYTNSAGTKTLLPVSAHHHDSVYSGLDHTHPPEGRLPHCSLTTTQNGATKSISSSTWTTVDIFTSNFVAPDVYGMWNPGNPSIVSIPVDGTYLVTGTFAYDGNTGDIGGIIHRVLINGTTTRETGEQGGQRHSDDNLNTQVFIAVLQLSAGDQIEIEVWQNTGATISLYSGAAAHHATTLQVIRLDGYSTAQDFAVGGGGSGGVAGPPFYAHIRRDSDYSFADAGGGKAISWESDLTPTSDEIVPMAWGASGVTIPKDGVYVVMGRVQMNASGEFDNARIIWGVTVNGSEQGFKEILRGHVTNSIFHVNTTPKFYSAGDVISAAIEVQGTTSGGTVNQADLVVVSQAGAGSEYLNPALAQEGQATLTAGTIGIDSSRTLAVTFPTPFASPPFVTLKQGLPGGSQYLRIIPHNITETGFTIYAYNIRSSSLTLADLLINWRAVGPSDTRAADDWHDLAYETGWTNYSSSWEQGGYRRDPDGMVILRGLVGYGGNTISGSPATLIATLPAGYRPAQGTHHLIWGDTTTTGLSEPLVLQIMTNGNLQVRRIDTADAAVGLSYLSLAGVVFSTNIVDVTPTPPPDTSWTTPSYGSNWGDYLGSDIQKLRYRRINGDTVELQGMAASLAAPASAETIFTLPEGFRPTERLIFSVIVEAPTSGWTSQRIDITPAGLVRFGFGWEGDPNSGAWISFTGISFKTDVPQTQ